MKVFSRRSPQGRRCLLNRKAKQQMAGGGRVVTFEIKGNLNTAKRFLDNLKLCYIGPSFGGVETLITHPALVSYYDYTRK